MSWHGRAKPLMAGFALFSSMLLFDRETRLVA
jgi:hypothetical protein